MSRGRLVPAAVAAAGARGAYALLRAQPPGGTQTWTRMNHRGEDVTLVAGPAVVAGGLAGAALTPGAGARYKAAMIVAGAGAAAFGGYDDLAGDGASKGFRGHLGALRGGDVTTGAIKLAGISAAGLAAALLVPGRRPGASIDVIIDAGLIAGGANLLNLFDLRPGRAIKVAVAAAGLMAGTDLAAAPVAAALALLPEDLAERAMLGDSGANGLGAMLGVAATALPRPVRLAAFAGIAGLTAASERVSFTKVIERTGPLRWLDMLGRRPVETSNGTASPGLSRPAGPAAAAAPAARADKFR